jgi:hypothetical protein
VPGAASAWLAGSQQHQVAHPVCCWLPPPCSRACCGCGCCGGSS